MSVLRRWLQKGICPGLFCELEFWWGLVAKRHKRNGMNMRLAGIIAAMIAILAIGLAYYAEYDLHLAPCELCLLERWPYRIVIILGLLALLLGGRVARGFIWLAGVAMLANIFISGLHVGVEFHWWASPFPECNSMLTPGAPLPLVPSIACDRGVYLWPSLPLTMTQMDFIGSICFTILLFFMASRPRRRR